MDELQISGKRFISSRRIARDNSYTSDYIGQLIRGGKVVGQKVGRAWYVDAISFDIFLGGEGQVQPVQQIQPEQQVQIETLKSAPPEKVKEEPHYVPLHIITTETPAETPAGLRYYSDERPSLPEIREIQIEKEETKSMSNDVFAPHVARRIRPVHIVGLAAIGITVFIFSAVVATSVSLNLRIDADNAASAYYGLGW